ncbi:rhomboid family intramembrane serine protease [Desulfonema ishimotonii]|uniref:Rhomboid family intramembrane serine protease n=1 Tax=Desulfonema ishimotonii TaxID=45657 RepID=A0A401FX13_9BACT|nr:rhomboid family intramembrane serine protease [Desulfonema ishimotonii]GBC61510.1 rhomboid family intramembrane serine protease [Desulfonema ishimotonii]
MTDRQRHSILCPNCNKLISIDEPRCPYCGTGSPGSHFKNNFLIRGFGNGEHLIRTIITVNAAIYLLTLLLYPPTMGLANPFRAFSPSNDSLLLLGATGTIPIDHMNRWWTLLSANYLHGSLLHIVFNMIAFRHIGTLIYQVYGTYRLMILYTLAGVAGYAVSWLAGVRFTIGASAGVCGLIGAALYYGKSRGGTFGQAVYKQVSGWVLGIFLFGLMPGINNWGHGGGIIAGIALGWLLAYRERRPERFFDKSFAAICMVATALILAWAVTSGLYYRIAG